jgi:hypothetical protein
MGESKRRRQQDPSYGKSRELTIFPVPLDELRDVPFNSQSERQMLDRVHAEGFQLWLIRGDYRGRDVAVSVMGDNSLVTDARAREAAFIQECRAGYQLDFETLHRLGAMYPDADPS